MIRKYTQLRILFPFALAGVLFLGSLWMLFFPFLPLTRTPLSNLRRNNEDISEKIKQGREDNALLRDSLAAFWNMQATAMVLREQEDMLVEFRERIESAAKNAGLRSRTTGNIRRSDVTAGILLLDVLFSAEGSTAEVVQFMQSLQEQTPQVYWRTVSIQPTGPDVMSLSGTLACLCFPSAKSSAVQHAAESGKEGEAAP